MSEKDSNKIHIPAAPPPIPQYAWRREEIRRLLAIPSEEFLGKYNSRIQVTGDLEHLYGVFAELLMQEVDGNNRSERPTRIILPVGPTGQYTIFLNRIIASGMSLANCHFFFMDEYCYEDGRPLGLEHPLGFRSTMERLLFGPLEAKAPHLMIPREQIYFPDPARPRRTQEAMDAVGGIDTCYGGIGIHGHVAFNEPEEGVEHSDTRVLRTNLATKTINMIRSGCAGFFGDYPEVAVTIGMKQILACPRIVLFPRNDILSAEGEPLLYVNTIVRLAAAAGIDATPAGDYPMTYCGAREPGNPARELKIYTTKNALERPAIALPHIDET
jgi:glucosamine-6-phosphate deaminase